MSRNWGREQRAIADARDRLDQAEDEIAEALGLRQRDLERAEQAVEDARARRDEALAAVRGTSPLCEAEARAAERCQRMNAGQPSETATLVVR